jgi:predicted neutral ceramidase superfamily lipid hydrolase
LGGDLPARLRTALSGAFRRIVFLHTYVDHTRNPAGRDAAISGITAAALRAAGLESRSGRAIPFRSVRAGAATAAGLRIDGLHLIFTTFAPERTDDVSPELGSDFLSGFGGEAVLVDGHNALGPGGGRSRPIAQGDPRSGDLGEAIAALRRTLDAEQALPLEIGISERAVRASGVRHCSALAFRVGTQSSAVVVLDANNLPTGVREEILRQIAALGIEAGEVVTTDTHLAEVPSVTRAEWDGAGRALVVDSARTAVREAMADLRPARIRYGIERIALRVWGPMFEKIVRAVPATARLGLIAGAGLILVFSLLAGLGATLLR